MAGLFFCRTIGICRYSKQIRSWKNSGSWSISYAITHYFRIFTKKVSYFFCIGSTGQRIQRHNCNFLHRILHQPFYVLSNCLLKFSHNIFLFPYSRKHICFFFSIYDTINVILKTTVLRFCFTVLFYRSKNFGGILWHLHIRSPALT